MPRAQGPMRPNPILNSFFLNQISFSSSTGWAAIVCDHTDHSRSFIRPPEPPSVNGLNIVYKLKGGHNKHCFQFHAKIFAKCFLAKTFQKINDEFCVNLIYWFLYYKLKQNQFRVAVCQANIIFSGIALNLKI